MSEFSDSLHFYNIPVEELKRKLQTLDIAAFILNEDVSPFSLLIGWEDKSKTRNFGCSLDFSFGEDHGVFCKFYFAGKLIARANKTWGPDFGYEEPEDSPNFPGISNDFVDVISSHKLMSKEDALKFIKLFQDYDCEDWNVREDFILSVGNLLNLKHYRNLSCEDMKYNMNSLTEINPNGKI